MYKLVLELSNYSIHQTKQSLAKFARFDLTIAWYPEGAQSDPDAIESFLIRGCILRRNQKTGEYEWHGPHTKGGIRRTYFEIGTASPNLRKRILEELLKQSWVSEIGANWVPTYRENLDTEPPIRMEI